MGKKNVKNLMKLHSNSGIEEVFENWWFKAFIVLNEDASKNNSLGQVINNYKLL